LDAKIELNNKINQELEAMAKTLYDYWFVQFDFPNEQGKPYKSSGGKMVYNAELKREIPEGWEVIKLVKNMNVQYGFPYSTKLFNTDKNGVPVIRIRDILESTVSLYSTEKADEKYKIEKGDLLIGMDGNFHMNFWDKNNCYLNQRCVKIKQKDKFSISTFQALFDTQPYIKAREKNVSRTTVGHLSANDINGLNILKASDNIQLKVNKIFNTTLDKILINRNENQQLTSLRDWLLPMLMNGQVSVKETKTA
jgi:type I restriction enzyme S subunit